MHGPQRYLITFCARCDPVHVCLPTDVLATSLTLRSPCDSLYTDYTGESFRRQFLPVREFLELSVRERNVHTRVCFFAAVKCASRPDLSGVVCVHVALVLQHGPQAPIQQLCMTAEDTFGVWPRCLVDMLRGLQRRLSGSKCVLRSVFRTLWSGWITTMHIG